MDPNGAPPLPPTPGGYASLVGGGAPQGPPGMPGSSPDGMPQAPNSPGGGQIGGAAVRMSMEIDSALKLLAQAVPALSPWVARVTMELRAQLGQALAQGQVPTSPEPQDNAQFPDGSARI